MLRRTMIACLPAALSAGQLPHPVETTEPQSADGPRLPNGRLQRDAILKSDFDKSLQEAADLEKLCADLRNDLEKASAFIVPLQAIKKTEEIEKLAKRIRGRLKRN